MTPIFLYTNASLFTFVTQLEKDFPMTVQQRSGLKLAFFEMETEDVELKTLDKKTGKPKIWKIKTLGSQEVDFVAWLKRFQEQIELAWVYYEKVLLKLETPIMILKTLFIVQRENGLNLIKLSFSS